MPVSKVEFDALEAEMRQIMSLIGGDVAGAFPAWRGNQQLVEDVVGFCVQRRLAQLDQLCERFLRERGYAGPWPVQR